MFLFCHHFMHMAVSFCCPVVGKLVLHLLQHLRLFRSHRLKIKEPRYPLYPPLCEKQAPAHCRPLHPWKDTFIRFSTLAHLAHFCRHGGPQRRLGIIGRHKFGHETPFPWPSLATFTKLAQLSGSVNLATSASE